MPGEIRLRRFEDHVEMVGEDDEGIHLPTAPHRRMPQFPLEPVPVGVVTDNVLSAVAAGHYVIDRTGELDAESS